MMRVHPRTAAVQVGEFAIGVAVAYAAVGAAWALSGKVWPLLLAAAVVVAVAITLEVRYGQKATGLVAGLLPTALLAASLFAAASIVIYRIG
jgi:hypothetical protein